MAAALAATSAPLGGDLAESCCAQDLPPYEVADGLAIHAGDIVLGTAEEVAAYSRLIARQRHRDAPRGIALPRSEPSLWPEGVIPYVIDEALPADVASTIKAAIAEWNRKTVIRLVPHSRETDYVRFVPSDHCASRVGRSGGEQLVWLGQGPPCDARLIAPVIHEIGHAVGLGHEHQRSDRDEFVTVSHSDVDPQLRQWHTATRRPGSPYDWRSTMHYSSSALESIPPGIEIPSEGLSAGDIDGVARLYGHQPKEVTIATNPAGLTIWVDGVAHKAPARFEWPPGTTHTVEVPPEPQERPGSRYLFGRWNDSSAGRQRTVTVGEDGTWIEANFIAQRRVDAQPDPPEGGRVLVAPAHGEWHTMGSNVRITAIASPRNEFMNWSVVVDEAPAGNPAVWTVREESIDVLAYFTRRATYRVSSNADVFAFNLDGRRQLGALTLSAPSPGRRIRVGVAATQPMIGQPGSRLRFERWSDGVEDREREIALGPAGGELRATFSIEHVLQLGPPRPTPVAGDVVVAPQPVDGYYPEGTTVSVTAVPSAGWEFARWTGSASGAEPLSVTMDAPLETEAWFTRTSQLRAGTTESITLPADGPGFRFAAPEGASRIALKFAPDNTPPGLEMQVRAFLSPITPGLHAWERLHAYSHQDDWLQGADFVAKPAADGQLELAIGYDTDPPLDPEALYFVVLVSDGTPVSGTLSWEVTSSGPRPPRARTWPRAFTFVSDAGTAPHPQTFELRNEGGTALQFDASSEAAWLAADPPRGSVPPGGAAEISVVVTGQAPADTHAATLDLSLGGPYGPLSQQSLPVTFVAVPPASAASAASRPPAN